MIDPGYLDVVPSASPLTENRTNFHPNISLSNDHQLSPTIITFPRPDSIDTLYLNCGSVQRDENLDTLFPSQDFINNAMSMNLHSSSNMKDVDYNHTHVHVHSPSGLVTPPDTRLMHNGDNLIHQTLPENASILIASKLNSVQSCLDEIDSIDEVSIKEVLNDAGHASEIATYESAQQANRSTLTTPVLSEHESLDFPCIETQGNEFRNLTTSGTDFSHNTIKMPIDTNLPIPIDSVVHHVSPSPHLSPDEPPKLDPKFPDSVEPEPLPTTPTEQPFPQHLSSSPASTGSPATSVSLGIYNNNHALANNNVNVNQLVNIKSEPLLTPSPSTCDDADYAAAASAAVDSVISALVGNKSPSTPTSFDPSLIGTGTDRLYSLSLAPPPQAPRQSFEIYNSAFTQPHHIDPCNHAPLIRLVLNEQTQPEYLTCPTCQKTLPVKLLLKQHREVGMTEEAKHVCQTCGRSFVREDKLKRHIMSIHTMEKPHVCHICTKAFSRK